MNSNKIKINTIIWALNLEKAKEISNKFTNSTCDNKNIFSKNFNNFSLNTFVRSPLTIPTSSPSGITDVIIIYISSNKSDEIDEAKKYLDYRTGIPIKILTSEEEYIEEAKYLDCIYMNIDQVTLEGRELILKEAYKFEETLLNCFKKFDIKKNGLISVNELINVSGELGYNLQFDDAETIVDSLAEEKSGNISFNEFKKWWVIGKSDFHTFRRLCKAGITINKLINKSSIHFNNYLKNLKKQSKEISQEEVTQDNNFNIHPKQNFENGCGIFIETITGIDAREVIKLCPDYIKNSPLGFSLKIYLSSTESAIEMVKMLNSIVYPLLHNSPEILGTGIEIHFRSSQNFVIAELVLSGILADLLLGKLSEINLSDLNMNASGTFHIFSEIKIQDLLNSPPFELFNKLMHLKFHLNIKTFNLRKALSTLCTTLENGIEEGILPIIIKDYLMIIKTSLIIKNLSLDIIYDVPNSKDLIVSTIINNLRYSDETNEQARERLLNKENVLEKDLYDFRKKYVEGMGKFQEFRSLIPEEFISLIKSVDLCKLEIEFYVNFPFINCVFKNNVNLPTFNLIKDIFLN